MSDRSVEEKLRDAVFRSICNKREGSSWLTALRLRRLRHVESDQVEAHPRVFSKSTRLFTLSYVFLQLLCVCVCVCVLTWYPPLPHTVVWLPCGSQLLVCFVLPQHFLGDFRDVKVHWELKQSSSEK